jgi:hypothetical protein
MMQVRNTTDTRAQSKLLEQAYHLFDIFMPLETVYAFGRAAAMFMLVIGTVLGGGLVSANAYKDSVPGDRLYGLKLAVEKTELMLAPNSEYRTRLHADFADRRMEETATLAEGSVSRYRYLPEVLTGLEGEVKSLDAGIETLRTSDRAGAVELAKNVERRLAGYRVAIRRASTLLPTSYRRSLDGTRDLVDGVSIKAMAVIVEHHRAGDVEAPKTVVASNFEEHLNQAEAKIERVATTEKPERTEKAKAVIAEAKELVTEGKYEAALTKMAEVVELTKEIDPATVAGETTPATAAGDGLSGQAGQ